MTLSRPAARSVGRGAPGGARRRWEPRDLLDVKAPRTPSLPSQPSLASKRKEQRGSRCGACTNPRAGSRVPSLQSAARAGGCWSPGGRRATAGVALPEDHCVHVVQVGRGNVCGEDGDGQVDTVAGLPEAFEVWIFRRELCRFCKAPAEIPLPPSMAGVTTASRPIGASAPSPVPPPKTQGAAEKVSESTPKVEAALVRELTPPPILIPAPASASETRSTTFGSAATFVPRTNPVATPAPTAHASAARRLGPTSTEPPRLVRANSAGLASMPEVLPLAARSKPRLMTSQSSGALLTRHEAETAESTPSATGWTPGATPMHVGFPDTPGGHDRLQSALDHVRKENARFLADAAGAGELASLARRYGMDAWRVRELKAAFDRFDVAGEGVLGRDALRAMLKWTPSACSAGEVPSELLQDECFRSVRVEGPRPGGTRSSSRSSFFPEDETVIDFDGFLQWFQIYSFRETLLIPSGQRHLRALANEHGFDVSVAEGIYTTFQAVEDSRQEVDYDSFCETVLRLLDASEQEISQPMLRHFWREAAGSSETIEFDTFLLWYMHHFGKASANVHARCGSNVKHRNAVGDLLRGFYQSIRPVPFHGSLTAAGG